MSSIGLSLQKSDIFFAFDWQKDSFSKTVSKPADEVVSTQGRGVK